jgi:DNA-binding MarR family transcriptional regulator
MYHASRAMIHEMTRRFRAAGYDVTHEQWQVLGVLLAREGQTQHELGEHLGTDKASVSRLVQGMEQRSLVVRVPNQGDGRSKLVYLTQRGKDTRGELFGIAREMLGDAMQGVSERDQQRCRQVLQQIMINLKVDPQFK